eukprot:1664833-Amphidinium_carterae.1
MDSLGLGLGLDPVLWESLSSSMRSPTFISSLESLFEKFFGSDSGNVDPQWHAMECSAETAVPACSASESYASFYYDYYYYWGDSSSYGYAYHSVCSCNAWPSSTGAPSRIRLRPGWLVVAWISAFLTMLALLNQQLMDVFGTVRQWIRAVGLAARADLADVGNAVLFLLSEFLLVCSRRAPFKQKWRKLSMRLRPYTIASVITGDPVYVTSPVAQGTPAGTPQSRATSSSQRRSLAQIQMDLQLVQGGMVIKSWRKVINPAVALRRARMRSVHRPSWRTTYNPIAASKRGNCLFAVLAKLAPGSWTQGTMRAAIRAHAARLLVTADPIRQHQSLPDILHKFSIDPTCYMAGLCGARCRWGNSVDVLVAADLFNLHLGIFDLKEKKIICDSCKPGRLRLIGYKDFHFVAGVRRSRPSTHSCSGLAMWKRLRMLCYLVLLCLGTQYSLSALLSTGLRTDSLVQGGMHAGHGVAGTGYAVAAGELDRPFLMVGEDENNVLRRHAFNNSHDLATMTARYRERNLRWADWHCQPLPEDPTCPLSGSEDEDDTELWSSFGSDSGSTSSGTPRAALVSRLRALLRSMAVSAHAPDRCYPDVLTVHALQNPLALPALQEEDDDFVSARLAQFGLDGQRVDMATQVDFSDLESNDIEFEQEDCEAARDRRICLLHSRLDHYSAGFDPMNDEPEIGSDAEGDGQTTLLNPSELAQLVRLRVIDVSQTTALRYPRLDVTWHLSLEQRWEADNDLDLLRFCLIANKSSLLQWRRVDRSPLTVDDLVPCPARCELERQAFLAWNNPTR